MCLSLSLSLSQERHCHWQLPIRSCCGSMLRVASQLEAFTSSTKVTWFVLLTHTYTHTKSYIEFKLDICVSLLTAARLFPSPHSSRCNCPYCSCASHQWQSVQLGAGASVWQADRFRVLRRLCGSLRVQSRVSAERVQCYPMPGHTRGPRTMEFNNSKLYR